MINSEWALGGCNQTGVECKDTFKLYHICISSIIVSRIGGMLLGLEFDGAILVYFICSRVLWKENPSLLHF